MRAGPLISIYYVLEINSEACERNFEEIAERLGKEQFPSFLIGKSPRRFERGVKDERLCEG